MKKTLLMLSTLLSLFGAAQAGEGQKVSYDAPAVSGVNQDGKTVHFADVYKKGPTVVFFYPKADTPGCTKQACSFRDNMAVLESKGVVVIGLSPDAADSHHAFRKKYGLPFVLVPDLDEKTARLFGAWGEKNLYGRVSTGLIRTTLVIDENGKIIRFYPNVRVEGHVEDILRVLDQQVSS